jgi:hypothetical protein
MGKAKRIIDQLREIFPAGRWIYDNHYFQWMNLDTGHTVTPVSVHSPLYDGDDDRFRTRYQVDYPTGRYVDEIIDDRFYKAF